MNRLTKLLAIKGELLLLARMRVAGIIDVDWAKWDPNPIRQKLVQPDR